jgi:hypothetical protein
VKANLKIKSWPFKTAANFFPGGTVCVECLNASKYEQCTEAIIRLRIKIFEGLRN